MITNMSRPRPIVQVIYRVVRRKDRTFVVEINIPGTWPTTTAQTFLTEAEAEVWIERRAPGSAGRSCASSGRMHD
jgi:ubiquinone/menaquinone biosynthesis C-methylase UbiE